MTVAKLYLLQLLCQAPSMNRAALRSLQEARIQLLTASAQTQVGKGHRNSDLPTLINKQELWSINQQRTGASEADFLSTSHMLEEKRPGGPLLPLPQYDPKERRIFCHTTADSATLWAYCPIHKTRVTSFKHAPAGNPAATVGCTPLSATHQRCWLPGQSSSPPLSTAPSLAVHTGHLRPNNWDPGNKLTCKQKKSKKRIGELAKTNQKRSSQGEELKQRTE